MNEPGGEMPVIPHAPNPGTTSESKTAGVAIDTVLGEVAQKHEIKPPKAPDGKDTEATQQAIADAKTQLAKAARSDQNPEAPVAPRPAAAPDVKASHTPPHRPDVVKSKGGAMESIMRFISRMLQAVGLKKRPPPVRFGR